MRTTGDAVRRLASVAVLAATVALGTGCELLFAPSNEFASNEAVLVATSRAAGFEVDEELFELKRVEVESDSLTFYYRGVQHGLDEAWAVRFAQKPGEQDPTRLADVYSHLPLIQELRSGFHLAGDGKANVDGASVVWVVYEFTSQLRDEKSRPRKGRGILATVVREVDGRTVVWAVNLDDLGAREELGPEALRPFLDAMAR